MKILVFSVTPSPYQRDFFKSFQQIGRIDLTVAYLEAAPGDTPWKIGKMEPWEVILPGRVIGNGRIRCHWNHGLPDVRDFDAVIVNAPLTGLSTQTIFHRLRTARQTQWFFWGELLLARRGWRGILQKILAAPLARASGVVAIGRIAQNDYCRRFPNTQVHNIPYTCDLHKFQKAGEQRTSSKPCRFLFVGQLILRKGTDLLLEAFTKLIRHGIRAELHLVGREGDLSPWMAALEEKVRLQIHYYGFAQPEALPEYFGRADVFVIPSRHDGWGVVVNQALGAGLPVITSSAVGAGMELVEDGVNGLLVPSGSVDSLFAAMRELATSPEKRTTMGFASQKLAAKLSPERAAARWLDVIETTRG